MRNVFGKVGVSVPPLTLLVAWMGLVAFSAPAGATLPFEDSFEASPRDTTSASHHQFLSGQLHAGAHLALTSPIQQGDSICDGVDTGVPEGQGLARSLRGKSLDRTDDFQVAYFNGSEWQRHASLKGSVTREARIPCLDGAGDAQCWVSDSEVKSTADVEPSALDPVETARSDDAPLPFTLSKRTMVESRGCSGRSDCRGDIEGAEEAMPASNGYLATKTFSMTVSGCEPADATYTAVLGDEEKDMTDLDGDGVYTATWDGLPTGHYTWMMEVDGVSLCSGTETLEEGSNVNRCARIWPCAALTVEKAVVGPVPTSPWAFTGTEPIGMFEIAPAGGITTLASLVPGSYTITETTKWHYDAGAVCDNGPAGSGGIATVEVSAGDPVTCVFTNTHVAANLTLSPESAINIAGESHVLTATLSLDTDGDGVYEEAPQGETIDFIHVGDGSLSLDQCVTSTGGWCTVALVAPTGAGSATVQAHWSGNVGSAALSADSNVSEKTWIDARIGLHPLEAINGLGDPHTFTITATASGAAPISWVITPTVTGTPARSDTCASPSVAADGLSATCTLVITSSEAGVFTATASAEEVFEGAVLHLETDGSGSNSGPARKTYAVPSIVVDKTANPTTLEEPGGQITFDVAVKNLGLTRVELTDMVDDVHGDLNGRGTCGMGGIILPGDSYECSFTADVTVGEGRSEVDTVTATVQDDYGQEVKGTDTATVTFISEQVPVGCVRVLKVDDHDEPLAGWTIHARHSGQVETELEQTTDASGWVTFSLAADRDWTFWEEMQDGWEPVTESQLELWVEETFTDCTEAQFQNRRSLPYGLYLPLVAKTTPGALQVAQGVGLATALGHHASAGLTLGTEWQVWDEDQVGCTDLASWEMLVTPEPDAEGCARADFVNQQGADKPYLPVMIKEPVKEP